MNTVGVIARREYVERIRQRGWIVGTIIGLIVIVGLSFMPLIILELSGVFGSPTSIAVVTPDAKTELAIRDALGSKEAGYDLHFMSEPTSGPNLPPQVAAALSADRYDAALVAYRLKNGDLAFQYYPRKTGALDDADSIRQRLLRAVLALEANGVAARQIERKIDFRFNVTSFNRRYRNVAEETSAQLLSMALLILMYISVILYGVTVAQGVIEEKSNRVMEIMIGALRPAQLLAGKILGIGVLALTQFGIFGIAGMIMLGVSGYVTARTVGIHTLSAMTHTPSSFPLGQNVGLATIPGATWGYLIVFFLLGFFSYATLSAGIGALASRAEDAQSASALYTIPMVAAYLLSFFAITDPEKPFIIGASMIPLLSPMVMFTRIAAGTVPAWQIAVSIALSLIAIWLLTLGAAKLYRVGVLMYGKPPRPADIWRALRSPA